MFLTFCVCRFKKNTYNLVAEFGSGCKLTNNNKTLFGVIIQCSCYLVLKLVQIMITSCCVSQFVFVASVIRPKKCGHRHFICRISRECINSLYVCDTDDDCSDSSKEDPSFCSKFVKIMLLAAWCNHDLVTRFHMS
jgi:Low-density lipoprotein receptor domain class A